MTTGIKVNGTNLAALETSDGAANPTNTLVICLKTAVKHNDWEILFREDVFSVSYKPQLTFNGQSAATVVISRAEAGPVVATTVNPVGELTAFRCDDEQVAYASGSAPTINQASPFLRICVHGHASAVQCDAFWAVTLTQDLSNNKPGSPSEIRVTSGTVLGNFVALTSISGNQDVGPKNARHKGCVLDVMLTGAYFQDPSPGAVSVTGEVLMSFKSPRGRRLGDGRQLQEIPEGETETPFSVDVPLSETPETPENPEVDAAAALSSFVAAGIIAAAAAAQCTG